MNIIEALKTSLPVRRNLDGCKYIYISSYTPGCVPTIVDSRTKTRWEPDYQDLTEEDWILASESNQFVVLDYARAYLGRFIGFDKYVSSGKYTSDSPVSTYFVETVIYETPDGKKHSIEAHSSKIIPLEEHGIYQELMRKKQVFE